MLSIIHITNRGLYPLIEEPHRHLSQYDLLGQCLREQTFTDYELIVVDKYNPLPRPEFAWLGERVRYLRPRSSPWDRIGAFAPSIARNTGLLAARGDVVFSVDDCTSFGPTVLESIAHSAIDARYVVPVYIKHTGERWGWKDQTHCGGILSYPRVEAIAAGGWEERFAGCYALEDWEFSRRMAARGVVFVQPPDVTVKLERHEPRNGHYLRCAWAVDALTVDQRYANGAWTPEQFAVFSSPTCTLSADGYCLARQKKGCPCDKRPTAETLAIMRECEC